MFNWLFGYFTATKTQISEIFVRESINIQKDIAKHLALKLEKDIYLYDSSGFFADAAEAIKDGIRYKVKANHYAVLSLTCQKTFTSSDQYLQFCVIKDDVTVDAIGIRYLHLYSLVQAALRNHANPGFDNIQTHVAVLKQFLATRNE